MTDDTGNVWAFGYSNWGSPHAQCQAGVSADCVSNIVGIAAFDTGGYNLVGSDGKVYSFGDAVYKGGWGSPTCGVTGMAAASDSSYWLVGCDGNVKAVNTTNYGSLYSNCHAGYTQYCVNDVVGITPTSDDKGYWLVEKNGGQVWAFGDASAPNQSTSSGVVGLARAGGSVSGYWTATSSGAVNNFTNEGALGSASGTGVNSPVVGIASTPVNGYWLATASGNVLHFGDASYLGDVFAQTGAAASPNIVGVAS